MWHNTVHCWLYDNLGNIYSQIRKDEKKLYTTASGHVKAGETIKEAFGREVKEEIGIDIDYSNAIFVNIYKFVMYKKKKDGSIFRDRAFSNVYVCHLDVDYSQLKFDRNELDGLVKINAKEALSLLRMEKDKILATIITQMDNKIITSQKEIGFADFLINSGETAMGKYEDVLTKIVELTENAIQ